MGYGARLWLAGTLFSLTLAASACDDDDGESAAERDDEEQKEQDQSHDAAPAPEESAEEGSGAGGGEKSAEEQDEADENAGEDAPEDDDPSEIARAFDLVEERTLDEAFLEDLSLRELSILRNAVFARAGNEFQTPWLDAFFRRDLSRYSPRGLDEDLISERAKANARRIAEFEDGLARSELEARWEELWSRYDAAPPAAGGAWSVPGPWTSHRDRIEARLLAEALDREFPPDPLFDTNASRPIPPALGGIRLGQTLADDADAINARARVEPVGQELFVTVRREEGEVRDIFASVTTVAGAIDEPPIDDLEAAFERQLTAAYGEPGASGEDSAWLPDDAPVWPGERHLLQLGRLSYGQEVSAVIALRTDDPARPCGPDDGFDETLDRIARAFDDDDEDALARFVHDPIASVSVGVLTRDGELPPEYEDSGLPPASFEDHFAITENSGTIWREARRGCGPQTARNVVAPRGLLDYHIFGRVDGEWGLTVLSDHVVNVAGLD